MDFDPHSLTLKLVDLTQFGFGSSWLYMGRAHLTLARGDLAWHGPGPDKLDISLGWLNSTWARVDSARHRPRPTRLGINLILYSTDLTWHRLNIEHGQLVSTSARAYSAQHRPRSTSTWNDFARHRHELTQIDMVSGRLGLTWSWAD